MKLNLVQIKEDLKKNRKLKRNTIVWRLYVLAASLTVINFQKFLIKQHVSERTFFRWKQAYLKYGVNGLKIKSGRGRKQIWIRGKVAGKLKYYRKKYNWGAEVLCVQLQKDGFRKISLYKINRFLRENKFVIIKTRKKKNIHTKKVVVAEPGVFTQIDVKHLTHLHAKKRVYAYNFVDHASKWSYKQIFDSYGPYETYTFVENILREIPFPIKMIQTDNGVEFTNKFISDPITPKEHALDRICRENNIRHKLIPVGEKEINGLVEKHHHLDFKEFYEKQKTINLNALNKRLKKHCIWRNEKRPYKALNWQTPNEFIAAYEAFRKINNISKPDEKKVTLAA